VWAKCTVQSFLMLKQVMHIIITVLYRCAITFVTH